MAYNKNNYQNNRLTSKQEKFVDAIMQGKSQYQSYIEAYPNAKNWKRNSVDCNASQLMDDTKIKQRLKELGWKDKKKVEWTRKRALEEINYVLDINKQDIERQQQGYEEEITIKQQELAEWVKLLTIENIDKEAVNKEIKAIVKQITALKQRRRVSAVNNNGILNAARVLNRMFGYDITKVEIQPQDQEKENMKELSIEELKAIAYANINRDNPNQS